MAIKLVKKIVTLAYYSDLYGTRWAVAWAETMLGLSLLWHYDLATNPAYHALKQITPHAEIWAALWIVSGLFHFHIINTSKCHTRFATIVGGLSAGLWWFTMFSIFLSSRAVPSPMEVCTISLAFSATWLWVRAGWSRYIPRRVRNVT